MAAGYNLESLKRNLIQVRIFEFVITCIAAGLPKFEPCYINIYQVSKSRNV